jgi:hypothetical protein
MQHPATTALRRLSQGSIVLSCYGLASMAILAVLGAATTGIHMFARTAAVLVLIGLVILGVAGAGNRRARRTLLAARPDLADAVRPGRYPPGNGMAVFVYVPFLVLGVCLGATVRQAVHSFPSGGLYDFVVATIFFALFSARAEVVYDRGCRAPYRGFLMHAAQSEPQNKLTAAG